MLCHKTSLDLFKKKDIQNIFFNDVALTQKSIKEGKLENSQIAEIKQDQIANRSKMKLGKLENT